MKPELLDLEQEQFWVLLLNRANMVIKKQQVSLGGITGTVVDPRIIFKLAIEHLASGIILIHNHPSGNVKPSDQDIKLTRQLKASAELLEITIFDHVIFANEGYFSLADENLL
jgi:DNA repair protein RadC